MEFNQFQRELQKHNIDPQSAYMFTLIYERLLQVANDVNANAQVCLALANSIQGFVGLHEATQKKVAELLSENSGVDVRSVAHDPNDRH